MENIWKKIPWNSKNQNLNLLLIFNYLYSTYIIFGLLWWLSKESACNAGATGLIPGGGRSPGEENSNPLQNSCLENSMDRGAWQAAIHVATESWTEWLTPLVIWAKAECQIILHPDWVKVISPQCRWLPELK